MATNETVDLDARVARALGYRAYREKRGEYELAVVQAPGTREPWMRTRTPDPERYHEVTCEEAKRAGFYGTGFPAFSTDIAAAMTLVERMRERGYWCRMESPIVPNKPTYYAGFTPQGMTHMNDGMTAPTMAEALCLAFLACAGEAIAKTEDAG